MTGGGDWRLAIVGLGPAGLDRLAPAGLQLLTDPEAMVIVRTLHHPAAAELAGRRSVEGCDDLYETGGDFEAVYSDIASRVMSALEQAPKVVYAVPGSALVGERAASLLRERAADAGIATVVHAGESFLDLVYARVGLDPIASGVQVLDGRDLPDPLLLHLPTIVTQVDGPLVVGDVAAALGRTLPHDLEVTMLTDLGSPEEVVETVSLAELARATSGPRTSLFLSPPPSGWYGLVTTNRRLRDECPWDRTQTHHSLLSHLIEETYETVEAVSRLPAEAPKGDFDAADYFEVEEELGDLLLQVVFHATLAREAGLFDVEEVAEGIRRKLVVRHPHVFGEVEVAGAAEVLANWETIKQEEKRRESLMDDVPDALPGIARADKLQRRAAAVGFDWSEAAPVFDKLREEVAELAQPGQDQEDVVHELGDVLFTAVNLARHLDVDPEIALRRASDKFADRFRIVERMAADRGVALAALTLDELDTLWEAAKELQLRGDGDHRR